VSRPTGKIGPWTPIFRSRLKYGDQATPGMILGVNGPPVEPGAIAVSVSTPAVTAVAGSTASPGAVAVAASVPAATATVSATVTPGAIAVTTSLPDATALGDP
jgi:hypothetical protein